MNLHIGVCFSRKFGLISSL